MEVCSATPRRTRGDKARGKQGNEAAGSSEPPGALTEKVVAVWVGLVLSMFGHTCSRNSHRTPCATGFCGISALNSFLLLRMSQFNPGRRFWGVQGSLCVTASLAPCAFGRVTFLSFPLCRRGETIPSKRSEHHIPRVPLHLRLLH